MKSLIATTRWTILFGVVVGVLLSPAVPHTWSALLGGFDNAYPVVNMTGVMVERDAESVTLAISGAKIRDCRYMGIQAFTADAVGEMTDAYRSRVDIPEQIQTKPPGVYSIGRWRVWPVNQLAKRILLFTQHECGGRVVTTKIADVEVNK